MQDGRWKMEDGRSRFPVIFQGEAGEERQIPSEAIQDDSKFKIQDTEQNREKHFEEAWQRYEYLIQQKELTEEDRQWLAEYMKSEEYRMLYGAQQAV